MSQAPYGETVSLKLRNISDEPVQFFTGGRPPHDFVVTMADGAEIWNWRCAKFILLPWDRNTLEPGESWSLWVNGSRSTTGENRYRPVPI